MKSIINFIINIFRAMVLVLMGLKSMIVTLPTTVKTSGVFILASANAAAQPHKEIGGFKHNMIWFAIKAAGVIAVVAMVAYTCLMIAAPFLNPVKFFGSLIGGVAIMTVFNYMIAERTERGFIAL